MVIRLRSISSLLLALLLGCSDGSGWPPVAGVVTLDGQPVCDAGVLFVPLEAGPTATATTDAAGRFQLTSAGKSGAPCGRYRVAISKQEIAGNCDAGPMPLLPAKNVAVKWLVPRKYSTADTSGLEAAVSPEQYEFTFTLTSH
jgi:hypothetical protein